MEQVKIFKTNDSAIIPKKATIGSAGYDLYACLDSDVQIRKGDLLSIPCGISIELPGNDYVALIFSRSGLGFKYGIVLSNGVGVIDSDYRGEIRVGLSRIADGDPYTIKNKDRIAQMIIMKIENVDFKLVPSLSSTSRGDGGFGSTGK